MFSRVIRYIALSILTILGSLIMSGCPNSSTPVCEMSGTITYLNGFDLDITGETCYIAIDVDNVGTVNNGNEVAIYSFTWQSGTVQDYAIDKTTLPPGTYYIRVYLEPVVGAVTWNIYGYYGGEAINEGHDPRLPTTIDCNSSFDFIIEST